MTLHGKRRLSLAPGEHYTGLVVREHGRLVVHCPTHRARVPIEECTRCGCLTGLSASGLGRRRGVYIECKPLLAPPAPPPPPDAREPVAE